MPSDEAVDPWLGGRRKTRRGTLNRDVIVAAARSMLEEGGLEALTMSRLAEKLGVKAMSLYTHFRDKDELLAAVADGIFAKLEVPASSGDDHSLLRDMMRAYYKLLIDYPDLLSLDAKSTRVNPAEARFTETLYGALLRLGFPPRQAVGLLATLLRFVIGCAYFYPTRKHWDENDDQWAKFRTALSALPAEGLPLLHHWGETLESFTQDDVFEFGLDTHLWAISRMAETRNREVSDSDARPGASPKVLSGSPSVTDESSDEDPRSTSSTRSTRMY